jgi:hypothetical protein
MTENSECAIILSSIREIGGKRMTSATEVKLDELLATISQKRYKERLALIKAALGQADSQVEEAALFELYAEEVAARNRANGLVCIALWVSVFIVLGAYFALELLVW